MLTSLLADPYYGGLILIINIIIITIHKVAGRKTRLDIQNYGCNGNLLCASPLCRAMEKRWNRNVVSRVSSVIVVIRLPIAYVSSMAISCHVPAVSMANG